MKELLSKLKKAVDRALDTHASTREINLAEFPGYVVKSLEAILADGDADRAVSRLGMLRAKVGEACGLAKQSAGAAEDAERQKITVTVFEEPGLSAKPKVESDTSPAAAGGALGASGVAGPNGMLGKALDQLRQEVAELKRLVGKQGEDDDEEEKKRKAKDDKDDEQEKAKAKDDEDKRAKAKDDEEDEDKRAKAKDDEEDEDKRAKAKDEEDEDKKGVTKAQWPLDMNATMPGAEAVEKRHPDLDWGSDPDLQGANQAGR